MRITSVECRSIQYTPRQYDQMQCPGACIIFYKYICLSFRIVHTTQLVQK